MPRRILRIVSLAALLATPSAWAAPERPESGDLSVSLGLPSGGNEYLTGAAGLWWLATEQVNLGFNLGLQVDFDEVDAYALALAPAARIYLSTQGRVSPFIHGQLAIRAFEAVGDAEAGMGIEGGLGAEVWLLPELSLAGHIGLGFEVETNDDALFATFTSGLTANIYFAL